MFGTIRRHQKWLWIVISTVTIISFVAFFSPQQRRQSGWTGPRDQIGSINGRPITRDEYAAAYREAELRYLFSYGDWPGNDAMSRQSGMMERETRNRLVLLDQINGLDIQVSEPAVAQWIVEAFRDRTDKVFRRDAYEQFVKNVLPSHGLTESDFERFARHEAGIQHLVALAGSAGKLVTPQEAEAQFRREHEQIEAEAVFISSSNYLAQVTPAPEAIATFYTNRQATYRIPEKMVVSYVKFAASNYVAEAEQELAKNTNLNQIVESTYTQRGTNAFKDPMGQPLSMDASKQKIRDEIRQSVALEQARAKAVEFANELFEIKEKDGALEKLASAKGLVSGVTEPFSQYETPPGLNVPSSFGQAAAKLTTEEPFIEQPIETESAVYMIALKNRIPSQVPPLESILDRVTQDYNNSKALELAQAAGRELQTALTNAVSQGTNFAAAASEKNVSPVVLAPFSRKATTLSGIPNRSDSSMLISTAFSLSPGSVSRFVETRNGGFIVHVKNVVPVAEATVQADLPEFTKTLRQSRQYQAFNEWFQAQMESARVNLPGDQKQASAQ